MRKLCVFAATSALLVSIATFGLFPSGHAYAAGSAAAGVVTSPDTSAPFSVYSPLGNVTRIASPSAYRGPGVQFVDNHNVPLQLTGVQYFVIAHHAGPDLPYRVYAAKGVQVGGIELADNLHAGTELMAVGIPTAASSAAIDAHSGTGAPTGSFQNAPSPNVSNGYAPLHLIWHDPVNIWVVEVFDILSWQYDGYMVDGINYTNNYEHLFPDGWFTNWKSYSSGYDYSSGRRYDAYDTTQGEFYNPVFCAAGGGTTFVEVPYNTSAGYYNGSRGVSIDTYDWGGCAGLLGWFWKWG